MTEETDLNMKFSVFHQEKAADFSFCDFLFHVAVQQKLWSDFLLGLEKIFCLKHFC